jgi:hypothetical protein
MPKEATRKLAERKEIMRVEFQRNDYSLTIDVASSVSISMRSGVTRMVTIGNRHIAVLSPQGWLVGREVMPELKDEYFRPFPNVIIYDE